MIIEVMLAGFHAAVTFVAIALSIVVIVLLVEVVASKSRVRGLPAKKSNEPCSYVVVIPAHNEVGTIERTLAALRQTCDSHGSVLVVADNCIDDTAKVSAAGGAEVIVRCDPLRRGKGYALHFAIRHLAAHPPDIVLILDADCLPVDDAIARLVASSMRTGAPQQARYEMVDLAPGAGLSARVGFFAWRVKNIVRPMGLANMGLPCLLMGTGMAFPWKLIAKSHLETGHLVEDMVLGLELTAAGHAPHFLPEACVRSVLPQSMESRASQRTRWETGHLQVIAKLVPKYLFIGVGRGDVRLVASALDAAVPPLAFLTLVIVATTAAAALITAAGGSAIALLISVCAGFGALSALVIAWRKAGRDLVSPSELIMLPAYVVSKLAMYGRAVAGKEVLWVRSKRD